MKTIHEISPPPTHRTSSKPVASRDRLRLYAKVRVTRALGPHNRFAFWVQGCPFRCEGCLAPDSQSFETGFDVDVADLSREILETRDIEGVTVSGGEPFAQAAALARLLERVRERKDLGVILYSGFALRQLLVKGRRDPTVLDVLGCTDVLIDGPYVKSLDRGTPLRGSTNQRIHFLTGRYQPVAASFFNAGKRARWRSTSPATRRSSWGSPMPGLWKSGNIWFPAERSIRQPPASA